MFKKIVLGISLMLHIMLAIFPLQAPAYEVFGKHYSLLSTSKNYNEVGYASWYGIEAQGKPTSSGAMYNMYNMTAAHKSLPLNTRVLVTNLRNGHTVVVKITDRGPFVRGRIIDLSYAAAKKLGMVNSGVTRVNVKTISSTTRKV